MAIRRTCSNCSYETDESIEQCPQCGHRMEIAQHVRLRGWILVATGTVLVVFMVVLAVQMVRIMAGQTSGIFRGDKNDAVFILGIAYLVAMFGGVTVLEGAWQLQYGRRNTKLSLLLLGLGFLFFMVGLLVNAFG